MVWFQWPLIWRRNIDAGGIGSSLRDFFLSLSLSRFHDPLPLLLRDCRVAPAPPRGRAHSRLGVEGRLHLLLRLVSRSRPSP